MSGPAAASEVELAACTNCGWTAAAAPARCPRCGELSFAPRFVSATGVTIARTQTDDASFLMVELDAGVRVLAASELPERPQIGALVVLERLADGTFAAGREPRKAD